MAFSRTAALSERPSAALLTKDLVGIGMNFAAAANPAAPIEETLIHASVAGMDDHDLRVLSAFHGTKKVWTSRLEASVL